MKVLAIGAHPDDIELGCGGTLLAHRRRGDEVSLLVMSTGERGPRDSLPRTIEQERAADVLGAELHWGGFEDCAVPPGRETIDVIENVLLWAGADVVYSHTPNDSHQDHRAVATATLAAGRRIPRICLYEAPTTTEFSPAVYVDVDGLVEDKLELLRAHESQVLKNGLVDLEAIQAMARCRGFQARIRNAEAFEIGRFVWDLNAAPLEGVLSDATMHSEPSQVASR